LGAAGFTREEVEKLIHEAVELHIESLREHGEPVPPPTSAASTVAVGVA
jgi:predicted RNase H-like HicB family nuclease